MKVGELLQELDGVDEDAEVRLAFQPNYPLEYETGRVAIVEPHKFVQNENDEEDFECTFCNEPEDEHSSDEETIVYIGEGGQTWRAYLPGVAAHALGWG